MEIHIIHNKQTKGGEKYQADIAQNFKNLM